MFCFFVKKSLGLIDKRRVQMAVHIKSHCKQRDVNECPLDIWVRWLTSLRRETSGHPMSFL